MEKTDPKSQKYFSVSHAILTIIENEGEEHLSHSKVARLSNVSRAWIYEYMGKNKEDLVAIAAETVSSFFASASFPKSIHGQEELKNHIFTSQEIAFLKIKDDPIIIRLYFRFKGTDTPVGTAIKKYEAKWLKVFSENLIHHFKFDPLKAEHLALMILTLRLGYYHQIATAKNKADAIKKASANFELFYHCLFMEKIGD